MIPETHLIIRLLPVARKPKTGTTSLNVVRGGSDVLLGWLETQLGLLRPVALKATRVAELAKRLETIGDAVFTPSMTIDRWSTTSQLLQRHDELRLAGWNGQPNDAIPKWVNDLGRATAVRAKVEDQPHDNTAIEALDEATRLQQILAAMDDGQCLPPHQCQLEDRIELWPVMWRKVLERMTLASAAGPIPQTEAKQNLTASRDQPTAITVADVQYLSARSETSACEFVAAILAQAADGIFETVIYCEDDALAIRLDGSLQRRGLPTMGASLVSRMNPVLQLLPVSLALCWQPVDPQVLLDFLALPVNPIPPRAARKLLNSLVEQPGLGSHAWDQTVAELCSPDNDPGGKLRLRLEEWLMAERVPYHSTIPVRLIQERCDRLALWARGRVRTLQKPNSVTADQQSLIDALQTLAEQSTTLAELVVSHGATISEPQLKRLIDEATETGMPITPMLEAAGGPVRVRSLAEIDAPHLRMIWLGLGTENKPACHWPAVEREQLQAAGIELDDGSHALAALRAAELRGMAMIAESVLAIELPRDRELRLHPVWLEIGNGLEPPVIEELLSNHGSKTIGPYSFETARHDRIPPPQRRTEWHVPPELLRDRETVSASELQDRLGCPLKWSFSYLARLKPSPISQLPGEFQLKGDFCHSILERLFGDGGDLPSVEEAVARAGEIFDQRLPLDAAPLAQPDQTFQRHKLRTQLINATRTLVTTLAAGGYRIAGIEVALEGQAFGKSMSGSIDCLAVRKDGSEAVIDFKFAGKKYHKMIKEGRAVQLATYAQSRLQTSGLSPAVAYLVLSDSQFHTPSGSSLAAIETRSIIESDAIEKVWENFSRAIRAADRWLLGAEPIPARPLQSADQWPEGVELVLNDKLGAEDVQETCRFCQFGLLCGHQELQ